MLERIECKSHEEWLAERQSRGIGGSEAAAIIGVSPWMTALELWKHKTGLERAKDLSDNAAVALGVKMEPVLRDFFAELHPEYRVEYHAFDILYQKERPWLFATLDGELFTADGRKGILEIKTATPNGKAGWEKWRNGNMPENYYTQNLHQLAATGYDFVVLFACLYSLDGTMTVKTYEIERSDVEADISYLVKEETKFWERNVLGGIMPGARLTL